MDFYSIDLLHMCKDFFPLVDCFLCSCVYVFNVCSFLHVYACYFNTFTFMYYFWGVHCAVLCPTASVQATGHLHRIFFSASLYPKSEAKLRSPRSHSKCLYFLSTCVHHLCLPLPPLPPSLLLLLGMSLFTDSIHYVFMSIKHIHNSTLIPCISLNTTCSVHTVYA